MLKGVTRTLGGSIAKAPSDSVSVRFPPVYKEQVIDENAPSCGTSTP